MYVPVSVCLAIHLIARFYCPNIAATLENITDPDFRSWLYLPASSVTEVQEWINTSTRLIKEATNVEDFIKGRSKERAEGYGDGLVMHIFAFPVLDKPGTLAAFMHGTHAIMDAPTTVRAFKMLCEWMVMSTISLDALEWGEEWKNLPEGPVTRTGGPREDFEGQGMALLDRVAEIRTAAEVWPISFFFCIV
jgi:hypothetical protein